ncbi:MAG: hypothetical protein IT369_21230 [Candidatus Latescibacteria bacterium]|nr:hypothetical protein [Candidatus Latescibacterota bacterium]
MSNSEPEERSYHTYEANPVPWWIALLWVSFFVFGIAYLVVNLVKH